MQYNKHLDGLRGYAISFVLLLHSGLQIFGGFGFGVPVFFTLSGYLITAIITPEILQNNFKLSIFFLRRAVRLLPALIVMDIVLFAATFYINPPFNIATRYGIVYSIFYISNWTSAYYTYFPYGWSGLLQHTWSLSVEAQYYLVWPILLILMLKKDRLKILSVSLVVISCLLAVDKSYLYSNGAEVSVMLNSTIMNLDCLLIGSAFAIYRYRKNSSVSSFFGLLAFIALMYVQIFSVPSFLSVKGYGNIFVSILAVVIISTFNCVSVSPIINFIFGNSVIVSLGKVSYSLYLWHYPIFTLIKISNLDISEIFGLSLKIFLSILASLLSYKLIERPALNRLSGFRKYYT